MSFASKKLRSTKRRLIKAIADTVGQDFKEIQANNLNATVESLKVLLAGVSANG